MQQGVCSLGAFQIVKSTWSVAGLQNYGQNNKKNNNKKMDNHLIIDCFY